MSDKQTPADGLQTTFHPDVIDFAESLDAMDYMQRCCAIAAFADKMHDIGLKNGRFGYVHKRDVQAQLDESMPRWWIADAPLSQLHTKIAGPFHTHELALKMRSYIEKVDTPKTYWVDEDASTYA